MKFTYLFGERVRIMHGRRGDDPTEEYVADVEAGRWSGRLTWLGRSPYNFGWGWQFGRNGDESDVGFDFHLGRWAHTWLRLRSPWLKWVRQTQEADPEHWYKARHTGFTIGSDEGTYFRWSIEARAHEWSSRDPWWKHGHIGHRHLFGRTEYEAHTIDGATPRIRMPEGHYQATATRTLATWRHVRWPGTWLDRVRPIPDRVSWKIEVPSGIPVEGKGTQSYNCGMDARYGSSGLDGPTLGEACDQFIAGVLRDRERYGGPHNLPHPMTCSEAAAWQRSERTTP